MPGKAIFLDRIFFVCVLGFNLLDCSCQVRQALENGPGWALVPLALCVLYFILEHLLNQD